MAAAPPDATVTESTEQVFSAARDAFMGGDYQRALDLSDQVLKATPDAAVVHEFRAMCLFALKRFDEAAAVDYAVLTAGPGWNWSTMAGLYPSVDIYTSQLRTLEAFARANPNSTSARFLLGYHYMVQGHHEAAAGQFEAVVQLQPNETLSAQFVKALRKAAEPAATATAAAPAAAQPGGSAGGGCGGSDYASRPASRAKRRIRPLLRGPPSNRRLLLRPPRCSVRGRRSPRQACRSLSHFRKVETSPGTSTATARSNRLPARRDSKTTNWLSFSRKARRSSAR